MKTSKRYEKAIERNLAELQRAILNRTTLLGIANARGVTSLFLQVCYFALFNDYISHCIKVFELNKQAASFWYIYRTNESIVESIANKSSVDIGSLREVSVKLKHIRDQTHFHIDSEGVLDPKSVWRSAGLTGKQLSSAVDAVWSLLSRLQQELSLPEVWLPSYYKVSHVHERVIAVEKGRFKG